MEVPLMAGVRTLREHPAMVHAVRLLSPNSHDFLLALSFDRGADEAITVRNTD
jgi:hypothetical protein